MKIYLALHLVLHYLVGLSLSEACGRAEIGKLRLVNGRVKNEGIVEVCQGGTPRHRRWRNICSNQWDAREAKVVCNQLGYHEDGIHTAMAITEEFQSGGVSGITYECNGAEELLSDCTPVGCELNLMIVGVHCPVIVMSTVSTEPTTTKLQSSTDTRAPSDILASTTTQNLPNSPAEPNLHTASTVLFIQPTMTTNDGTPHTTSSKQFSSSQSSMHTKETTVSTAHLTPSHTTLIIPILPTSSTNNKGGTSNDVTSTTCVRSINASGLASALVICTLTAAFLFVIIVSLVVVAILLTMRGRKSKQKQERALDNPVYEAQAIPDCNDEQEHNLENPLYGDPHFLPTPRVTESNVFILPGNIQPRAHRVRNDYETIDDDMINQDRSGESVSGQSKRITRKAEVNIPIQNHGKQSSEQNEENILSESDVYSQLCTSQDYYATLEPHISNRILEHTEARDTLEDDYSHLKH